MILLALVIDLVFILNEIQQGHYYFEALKIYGNSESHVGFYICESLPVVVDL